MEADSCLGPSGESRFYLIPRQLALRMVPNSRKPLNKCRLFHAIGFQQVEKPKHPVDAHAPVGGDLAQVLIASGPGVGLPMGA